MTLVDAETGEIVPVSTEPTSLVAVAHQCASIEQWADTCDSIPELRDANNKLAAIDEYLNRTSTEGRARVAEAQRHLEVRIGSILGPPKIGRPETSVANDISDGLTRNERSEFRAMADNADVVEAVVAESTDEAPASRRKVMKAIKQKVRKQPAPLTDEELEAERLEAELEQRVQRLRTAIEMLAYEMPDAAVMAAEVPERVAHRFDMHLDAAAAWLGEFQTAWSTR